MARRTRAEAVDVDDLEGTVEGLARDHFEREKAAYEARTGEKVEYYLPVPLTRTPIGEPSTTPSDEASDTPPNQGGEPENEEAEGQGDE